MRAFCFIFAINTYSFMKGVVMVFLFLLLLTTLIILVLFIILAISIGGAIAIILFGDVIVCIFLIVWIIKKMCKKKK